jgi:micrococcal nuclease
MIDSLSYELLITRVIDGDTYVGIKKQVIQSGKNITLTIQQKIKIRLYGVDTPETRGKNKTKKGIFVKNYVKSLLEGKIFVYKFTGKKDSFGRELGDVMLSGERPLSLHLVSMGYAREMKK